MHAPTHPAAASPMELVRNGDYPRWVAPIRIALLDDYDIVLTGLSRMLEPYRDRIEVVELDADSELTATVDIALYDTFAQGEADSEKIGPLIDSPRARRVVIYTWNFDTRLLEAARDRGVSGYLSKTLPARELVDSLVAVHAGEYVVSRTPVRTHVNPGLDWPGRHEGLSDRESEVLALITQGHSNAEIAATTYLSPNTVKSYIRALYRKIGVSSRTQAVLWGVRHGFNPGQRRVDEWALSHRPARLTPDRGPGTSVAEGSGGAGARTDPVRQEG